MSKIIDRTKKYGAVIVFFVFSVCLYGPIGLFLRNADELWFSLQMLLSVVIPISLSVLILLLILCWILPETKRHIFIKILFGVTLALYIQGNFLNISYGSGVLDGSEIIWSNYTRYAILDTLAWVICLALPFVIDIAVRRAEKKFFTIITLASLFFVAIQIPAFISEALSYHPEENKDFVITTDHMFELGKSDNILVFILDTMDEEYFQEFAESHPEYVEKLEGFVHYDNVAAAGSRTIVGLPAMFTGTPFTRNESYSEYLHHVWSLPNAFSVLHGAGYRVDVYSETTFFSSDTVNYIDNFREMRGEVESQALFANLIYQMNMYTYAPHLLKKYFIYDSSSIQRIRAASDNAYRFDDYSFYQDMVSNGFSIDKTLNHAVKVYHLEGAHAPYKMNEKGERSEKATLEEQVTGHFYYLIKALQELKDLGIYDNSTILITTDHGELHKCQYAMFLLKEAESKGQYRTSSVPITLFDLPVYLASLAGKKLENNYGRLFSQIREDDNRERHFFKNTNGHSRIVISEYVSEGRAGDYKSWKVVNNWKDETPASTEYSLGTLLDFTTEATGNIYTFEGFGNNTGYQTKTYGPIVTLKIPIKDLPSSGSLKTTIRTAPPFIYPFIIRANDTAVLDCSADNAEPDNSICFDIPVELFEKDHLLTLDICFPDIDMSELEIEKTTKRTYTGAIKSILIEQENK